MTSPARILIVDDSEPNIRVLTRILKQGDYHDFHCVTDSRLALAAFESYRPDLVLLDLMMPHLDGMAVLEQIHRALPANSYVPVLMLTADNAPATKRRALGSGANDFLSKPLDAGEVILRIKNLLHARQLHTDLERHNQRLEDAVFQRTAELQSSEERYALAAEAANDGLWDWNLETDDIYFSPRWKAIVGDIAFPSRPDAWFDCVHPTDLPKLLSAVGAVRDSRTDRLEVEYRMKHTDGAYRWVLTRGLAAANANGANRRLVGSQSDVTVRKATEEQLFHDAFHDALTKLPNRALFVDRLGQRLAIWRRSKGRPFAVLFVDLNRFKAINDTLGHPAGDEMLIATARRLAASIRAGDTVARLGGDEFTILLDEVQSADEAALIAERIAAAITQPVTIEGQEVVSTASVGVALPEPRHEFAEELLRDADTAMYEAKASGAKSVVVFDASMTNRGAESFRLESELRRALARREFAVHYQPIVSLPMGGVVGFEALVRWRHPTRGLLMPCEFIRVSEETGQIAEIGEFVLEEACRQLVAWDAQHPSHPPLTMSVNVSPRQFAAGDIARHVRGLLDRVGLAPHRLDLEITETTMMQHPDRSVAILEELRGAGVGISIDDFGIGHSSLNYLQQFPVQRIKIDRTFIHRMGLGNAKDQELVRIIVLLARNLGLQVVAEGVEYADQVGRLDGYGCQLAQGYLFARPQPAADVEVLIPTPLAPTLATPLVKETPSGRYLLAAAAVS